jgi:hypothetical protein
MAIDTTKFTCYPQGIISGTKWDTYVYGMEEGVGPAERGLSPTATVQTGSNLGPLSNVWLIQWRLPLPPDGVLKAGTYELAVHFHRIYSTGTGINAEARLVADGTTTIVGAIDMSRTGVPRISTAELVLSSDVECHSSLVAGVWLDSSYTNCYATYYPYSGEGYFGVKSGVSGGSARNALVFTPGSPDQGSHASPTPLIGSPEFAWDAQYLYKDDTVGLVKYVDSPHTEPHALGASTTQTGGSASSLTQSFQGPSRRRLRLVADAARKPDVLTNTYYKLAHMAGATEIGALAYETRLSVERPMLASLAGTAALPLTVTDAVPVVHWSHVNASATHYRIVVRNAATSAVVVDSGEQTGAALQGAWGIQGLENGVTYCVMFTSMSGSGGSLWSIDSECGYFITDWGSTALKIISHEGTSDTPQIITSTAPTITWDFARPQIAYNLVFVDAATNTVTWQSGWVPTSV